RDFHVTGVQTCALPISAAIEAANELESEFLRENTMFASLAEFLHYVQYSFRHGGDRPRTAEMLGHYLAMQAIGHGVGLSDAFGKIGRASGRERRKREKE